MCDYLGGMVEIAVAVGLLWLWVCLRGTFPVGSLRGGRIGGRTWLVSGVPWYLERPVDCGES